MTPSRARSRAAATDWRAPRCTIGAKALKIDELDVGAGEADGVAHRVAVDLHLDDRGVDQPHVEALDPALPADAPLGLAERIVLHPLDDDLQLRFVQGAARVVAAGGE